MHKQIHSISGVLKFQKEGDQEKISKKFPQENEIEKSLKNTDLEILKKLLKNINLA